MKSLVTLIKDWFVVKTAKNPSPDLEEKIEQCRRNLHEQVSLLRLSNSELTAVTKNFRFEVIQELINDIDNARSKKRW